MSDVQVGAGRELARKAEQVRSEPRHLLRELAIFTFLLVLVALLRLPSLNLPFENDSGDHAYHAWLILEGFPIYGVHHPAHHMPGVYYLYALAFKLLGTGPFAIKLFLIGWLGVTVYLIYRLGTQVANRAVGLLAAILSALLLAHLGLSAHSARRELFVLLPHVAALLVLFALLKRADTSWKFSLVGLFAAGAFLIKANYLSPLALAGIALLFDLWRQHEPAGLRIFLRRSAWIAAGFIAAVTPVFLYFAGQGLLDRFLMAFQVGQRYLAVRPHPTLTGPEYIVLYPLAVLALNNALILIFAAAALVFIAAEALRRRRHTGQGDRFFIGYIALWFPLVLLETNVSRAFLTHYYLIFIPSLTILAAWFLVKIYKDAGGDGSTRRVAAAALVGSLLALTVLLSVAANFSLYTHYARYATGAETNEEFMVAGLPDDAGTLALEMQDVAGYVRQHTDPDDRVYYWGNFMEFYYLARRQSVIDMIWPITVGVSGPPERIFAAEVIVVGDYTMVGVDYMPEWLESGLEEHYELEATIHGRRIYRRL